MNELQNLMKKYDVKKVLILRDQMEANNVDISNIFYDHIHFNEFGHKIVASVVSKYLKENYEKFN